MRATEAMQFGRDGWNKGEDKHRYTHLDVKDEAVLTDMIKSRRTPAGLEKPKFKPFGATQNKLF